MNEEELQQENERLRRENTRLKVELEELRAKLTEPEEVIRAIRQGEIDALVVQEEGEEEIYSLQRFDSVYRTVVEECFPYGVWLAEVDGRLLYVTPSFLELLQTDLRGLRDQGQFFFLPPEVRETVEREWTHSRKTGQPCNVEYSVQLEDGAKRTIWTYGILAQAHDGLSRWVGVNIDVTEREKIKNELRQQAEALKEADRRKDEFLALLGHELRNPLAAIQNGLHILLLPDIGIPVIKQIKEMMKKQLSHLTRLVDDLLDVSRITRGTVQLRKEAVELAPAVRQAIESVRPFMETQRHELTVSLTEQPVYLSADPTRLEQILVNLLHNAAKYTQPGGAMALLVEHGDGRVVIRVRDNGIGIPLEMQAKVFDLFVQADRTLDRSQGGLGIGLTLVKKLVEMHHGSIRVHSEGPDRGSEFIIELPTLARGAHVPESQSPAAIPDSGSTRVLIVDDSEDLAESLRTLVAVWGHEVRTARDGPSAIRICRMLKPEVVILDIGLPQMNGYEVARQLRREQGERRPLLVALSGYCQEEDKRRAYEAGFDLHMTKPIDPTKLESLISSRR